MNEASPHFQKIFFDVFEALPRQGPGNRASVERALGLCKELPETPAILDLGCGVGAQTMMLAQLTSGSIVAIDRHAPSIERLKAMIAERGLAPRVSAKVADMTHAGFPPESFDMIWSEGALYNIGLDAAFGLSREWLRPGGYLVFTDAVWRKDNPPREVAAIFESEYPAMGRVDDVLAKLAVGGFDRLGHFTLPDEAWWDDFYTPMERRIDELRGAHAGDAEVCSILDQLAGEPEMHRRFSDYYAYEFFIARKADPMPGGG